MEETDLEQDNLTTQHELEVAYADDGDMSPEFEDSGQLYDTTDEYNVPAIQRTTIASAFTRFPLTKSVKTTTAIISSNVASERSISSNKNDNLEDFIKKNREVRKIQSTLQNSFDAIHSSHHLRNERDKMKRSLDTAFKLKLSTSVIIIDPTGRGKLLLIDEVLSSYNLKPSQSNSCATVSRQYIGIVNGMLIENDFDALTSLAGQFLVRSKSESQVVLALEDLETHFAQCKVEGRPAVIVLEEYDRFANHKRQTLLYSLLDLMHKKELLFIMIGITGRADVQYMLEKRILSRLNAQYVYMSHASAEDIARDLYDRLVLSSGGGDVAEDIRVKFNKHLVSLFGRYRDSDAHIKPMSSSTAPRSSFSLTNGLGSASSLPAGDSSPAPRKRSLEVDGEGCDILETASPQMRLTRTTSITSASASKGDLAAAIESFAISSQSSLQSQSPVGAVRTRRGSSVDKTNLASPGGRSKSADLASSSSRISGAKMRFSQDDTVTSSSFSPQKKTVLQRQFETDMAEAEMLDAAERAARERDDSQYELLSPGSLLDTIRTRREWGQGIEYFSRVAITAVQMLSADTPYITKELFLSAMTEMEPPTMAERISQLPELELYLLTSLTYMHLHCPAQEHFSVGQMVVEFDKMTSALRDKRVQKIRVVEAVYHLRASHFICLYNHQMGRHSVLEDGLASITSQTVVFLSATLSDVVDTLLNRHTGGVRENYRRGLQPSRGMGRPQPTIAMSENARRLIRTPTSVNLYLASGSATGALS